MVDFTRPARVVLVSLLAFGLAGCGGGGGDAGGQAASPRSTPAAKPPPVPEGFVRYTGTGYTVAHPKGWGVRTGKDDSGAQVIKITAPDPDGPEDEAELLIGRLPRFTGDFARRIVAFRSSAELAGRRIVAQRGVRLPKATQAWRLELAYPAKRGEDTGEPSDTVRMEDLQVLGTDRTLTEVAVRARQDTFERLGLARILPTFRLR